MNNSRINRFVSLLRNNRLFNLVILTYVCFHSFFESLITNYLINPFFLTFENNWLTISLFILGIILLIYSFVETYRNNKFVSDQRAYIATIIILFWFYYRFFYPNWEYIEVGSISFLKYVDITLVGCISILLSKVFYKKKVLTVDDKLGLMSDNAIVDESQDKLGRKGIAADLATKIINSKAKSGSLAIGIVAPWGYGKTSFLNLLGTQLSNKGAEIIRFNPWIYEKEKSLTIAFFAEVSSALKKYNPELATNIKDYAQLLSSIDTTATKVLSKVIEHKQKKDINAMFSIIDKTIQNIGKQIIIYIDDLDRLDKNEISEILKLIRNSANFSNMIFVGAYDRNYLINALQQINSYQSPIYLEKIFQFEFTLPDFDSDVLKEQIFELSEDFIKEEDIADFKKALLENRFWTIYTGFVDEHINSIRDVKRFVNTFRVAYERLQGEVDIVDLMNVELLRFKFPNIYDLLVSKWNSFFIIKDEYHSDQLVLWSDVQNKQSNQFAYVTTKKIDLKKYIINNLDVLGIREQRVEEIMVIINAMFPEYGSSKGGIKKINNVNAIRRYFYYSLLDSDLSDSDFNQLWSLPYEEIKREIDGLIVSKSRSLVTQIANKSPNGTEEYMKLVRAIFYIGSISKGWRNDYGEITKFLSMRVFSDSNDQHIVFILDTLRENWDNEFALQYLQSIYSNSITWDYILSKKDVVELNLDIFKRHLNAGQSVERCLYYLQYTTYIDWKPAGGGSFTQVVLRNREADLLFINYAKSNIESFINSLVVTGNRGQISYYINNIANTIWESWENFEMFMYNIEVKSPTVLEFIQFMELCKEQNYSQGVVFDFKEITPSL